MVRHRRKISPRLPWLLPAWHAWSVKPYRSRRRPTARLAVNDQRQRGPKRSPCRELLWAWSWRRAAEPGIKSTKRVAATGRGRQDAFPTAGGTPALPDAAPLDAQIRDEAWKHYA